MGDTGHSLGTGLRTATGVGRSGRTQVFTLLRNRAGSWHPAVALSMRIWPIMAHVWFGALIVGTAISEVWLSLDAAGQWLFGIYGSAPRSRCLPRVHHRVCRRAAAATAEAALRRRN